MAKHIMTQVWGALQNLNPSEVRELAGQPVRVGLAAASEEDYEAMEEFLCPPTLTRERRIEIFGYLYRIGERGAPERCEVEICGPGVPRPDGSFLFHGDHPQRTVTDILRRRENLAIPLARTFPPFRSAVAEQLIHTVSKENALFSLATALPDIVPSLVSLPWAVGQFASDTAFLTVNQVRLAFLLAAASDREIGYKEQRNEIGSILAGAFGWRAIARELVGKIPMGGGLIPKAAIAYAGTFVAGRVLERLYREGYTMSRAERQASYESAFEKGKRVASELLAAVRQKRPA